MSAFNSTTLDTKLRGLGAATIADDWQHAALSYALTRIANVRTVDDILAELA